MSIKSFEELESRQAACTKCLDEKFSGESGKRAIVLCGTLIYELTGPVISKLALSAAGEIEKKK